jgi:hypothetical protein
MPASQAPHTEVLEAQADDFRSDIFPDTHPENSDGPLGSYQSYKLNKQSPLWPTMATLLRRRAQLYSQERQNRWTRTEETKSGLLTIGLQTHLISCTENGYSNLLEAGYAPTEALDEIDDYVEDRDAWSWSRYNQEINDLVGHQAMIERATARLANSDVYGSQQRQARIEHTRLRLERLKFEWISARAIGQLLREQVTA